VSGTRDGAMRRATALDEETLRRDYARNLDNRLQAAMLGVLALGAALYPLALQWLVGVIGLRPLATVLAVAGVAAALRSAPTAARLARAGTAATAALAALAGSIVPLLLLAPAIHAALAWMFLSSLRDEQSIIERAAKTIQPAAPDFIGPYCRGVTMLWGIVFAFNAAVLIVVSLTAPVQTWQSVAGYGIWTCMGILTAGEFLVRKTYFRNYWYRGPFEQIWSRLFPADATPMGRRSAAHIAEVRAKLGLDSQ